MSNDQTAPAAPAQDPAAPAFDAQAQSGASDVGVDERIAALQAQLEAARDEAEQFKEQALRARAEADNVRKRTERDLENAHKYALERFVAELLPVKDSLELGLAAACDGAVIEDLREGTQMTLRMLGGAMEKFAVRELSPQGEPFDPQLHQAMSAQESAGAAAGTVLQVVQKGYLLNERLVRPALVIVAK